MDILLGDLAEDRLTGFVGIVVARTMWLNGCIRYLLEARKLDKDDKQVELWFDEQRVTVKKRAAFMLEAAPRARSKAAVTKEAAMGTAGGPPIAGDPSF